MLQLNTLDSLCKDRKRRGRGGSRGGTSGRGHKGQLARSGGGVRACFEGGQMPLSRRLPRRGFTNRFRTEFHILSLSDLDRAFNAGDVVNAQALRDKGLVKGKGDVALKVLANGTISKALVVEVHACTGAARQSIERAGGSVTLLKEMSGDSTTA
ncbi:MAG: large subunit ribosomal protein [Candidatus Dependentiae bacterium]|nr:large subunit ribosomal protein [Candidatus Dependentiae bacterium]